MSHGRGLIALVAAAAAVVAMPARAQTAQIDGLQGLEEIVVTATKRPEKLQDVPIAVTAISGGALDTDNIVESREIVRLVPSLVLSGAGGGSDVANFSQGYSIRGVGTQDVSPTLAQSVSVVLDGIALGQSAMGRMDYGDIDRIEVLEGPQGMLFGRNASAGLVNIVTNAPVLNSYQAIAHASFGTSSDFNDVFVQATGNIPIGQNAALRVNTYYQDRSGLITNEFNGNALNAYADKGIKAKFLWDLTDSFEINFSADYSWQHDPYRAAAISAVTPGSPMALELAQYGITAGPENTKVINDAPDVGSSAAGGSVLRLAWKLGDYNLTSTTGYRIYTMDGLQKDNDNSLSTSFNIATIDGPMWQYSEELQLTSPSNRPVEYVAGLFYDHFVSNSTSDFGGGLPSIGFSFLCSAPVTPSDFCVEGWNYSYKASSVAAYGQATIHLGDRWRFIAGGRGTHDFNNFTYENSVVPGYPAAAVFFPLVPHFYQSEDSSNFSWRVGPQFQIAPDTMAYATVSTGYKSPGFNSTGVITGVSQIVRAETSTDYEIGLKSSWLDRRLVANVDAFYTDFKNFQTQVLIPIGGGITAFQDQNAGGLRTAGFGVNVAALPVEGLRIAANVAFTDAVFTDYPTATCYTGQTAAQGCNTALGTTNAAGNPLPDAPKWIYTISGDYKTPLTSRLQGLIGTDYYYRTDAQGSQARDPVTALPAYGLLGAYIGVGDPDGRWKVTVSGKNLLNKFFPISIVRGFALTVPAGALTSDYFSEEAFRAIYLNLEVRL
jgi:iron complex outermembrane receptor protein